METESLHNLSSSTSQLASWHPAWRPESEASAPGGEQKDGCEEQYSREDLATQEGQSQNTALNPALPANNRSEPFTQPVSIQEEQPAPETPHASTESKDDAWYIHMGANIDAAHEQDLHTREDPGYMNNDTAENVGTRGVNYDSGTLGQASSSLRDYRFPDVSQSTMEVSWDTKDHVEHFWGPSPKMFDVIGSRQLDHTNSFPDVPAMHKKFELPPFHSLPHSQVEDIMEKNEVEAVEIAKNYNLEFNARDQPGFTNPFESSTKVKEADFFGSVDDAAQIVNSAPLDEEARFEEGLLLISKTSTSNPTNEKANNEPEDFFGSHAQEQGNDEDFFASTPAPVSNEVSLVIPSLLKRKTTYQVLDSIKYLPRSEVHDSIPSQDKDRSIDNLTGGGIAVSTSTVVSHVLADITSAPSTELEGGSAVLSDGKEDDLAAMWQAALADDDFLDEETSVDPTSFFDGDEDGFLDETNQDDPLSSQSSPPIPQQVIGSDGQMLGFNSISTKAVRSSSPGVPLRSRYSPQQTESSFSPIGTSNLAQQSPYATTSLPNGFESASGPRHNSVQQSHYFDQDPTHQTPMPKKNQSFADKSKGGYTSPYDLPMEVSRPKRRVGLHNLQKSGSRDAGTMQAPPPRSSSMQPSTWSPSSHSTHQLLPTNPSGTSMSPSISGPLAYTPNATAPKLQAKATAVNFFEELPVISKLRPASSSGNSVSQTTYHIPPQPQISPQPGQFEQAPRPTQPLPVSSNPPQPYQLLPSERALPYAPLHTISNPPMPTATTRYSPAPPAQANIPLNHRYATPPTAPPRPPSVSQILPFQPRRSSPLARSASATNQYRLASRIDDINHTSELFPAGSRRPSFRTAQTANPSTWNTGAAHHIPAPLVPSAASHYSAEMSSDTRTSYTHPLQQTQLMSPDTRPFESPQRSQTQSPGSLIPPSGAGGFSEPQWQRPASITGQTSPISPESYIAHQPASIHQATIGGQALLSSPNFVIPSDGSETDPLERWKGCPVFNIGFGGNVITSFPQQIPRYAKGQLLPMIKCIPGEVKVRTSKIIPLDEHITTFPGPLKSKSKKKEVLSWLEKGIMRLEQQQVPFIPNQTPLDIRKRQEEKVLLWRILFVLIEFDGTLDGDPAEKAIRRILSPELSFAEPSDQMSIDQNARPRGASTAGTAQVTCSAADPESIESLRKLLLQGEREKAVWHAADKQLWGHAMIIASTLPASIWKQVTQEFVRVEVKTVGGNAESLAALYDVFSGNWEESVDELVPPSARAGLRMVSKTAGSGPSKNALDGLDRWRETLSLILSNRSADDTKAMIALGRLLASYGRVEAAHICYIFSKSPGLFGGPDDPQASITLLGVDHTKEPFTYGRDLNHVLLTEIYEFAFAVLTPSTISTIAPHLQAHKLHHAMVLAEYGYRDEALQYCDAIMNILKATTKPSPYYHGQLINSLDDLSSRLRQAPKDGSSSWAAKPSMDKFSGSVWNRFNQFISGDDSDAASAGSGKAYDGEAGPFAKISGDTPSVSRAQSPDLYGSYANGVNYAPAAPAQQVPPANSRYAPSGTYTPRTSLEQPSHPIPSTQRQGHLESLKRADIQQQSSYSSPPTLSPDLHRNQQPSLFDQIHGLDSPPLAVDGGKNIPSLPTQSAYTPEAMGQSQYGPFHDMPEQRFAQPEYQETVSRSSEAIESASMSQHLSPHSVDPRSPPYEPRSAAYQNLRSPSSIRQRSPSYEPRPTSSDSRSRSYQPSPISDKPLPSAPYSPPAPYEPRSAYEPLTLPTPPSNSEPTSASYEATRSYGYEPPASSSYDPPSYDPETQDGNTSPVQEIPKNKSFMNDDDDDDLIAKAAALKKEEKARKDREADEAFRKAAEADGKPDNSRFMNKKTDRSFPSAAQKDSRSGNSSKGWLSWLAPGSKAKDAGNTSATSGPIRAKLGEESSFVYDANLKKWVNKKAGAEAPTASAPTPPPPRGPPSRGPSAAGGPPASSKPTPASLGGALSPGSGPPSSVPSRNVSPSLLKPRSPETPGAVADAMRLLPSVLAETTEGANVSSDGAKPPSIMSGAIGGQLSAGNSATGPPSAPPSRPATGMSNASSIDDLIGAPQARKGGTVKKAKKGRYVDVMAK